MGVIHKTNDIKEGENVSEKSFIKSKNEEWHYYMGIIDTLTNFGAKKSGEYMAKRIIQGSKISCIPPIKYKKRFLKFMKKIIISSP